MSKEKMKINPDKFSLAVISGMNLGTDPDKATRTALKSYLQAYYFIQKFNSLESDHFSLSNRPDFVKMVQATVKAYQDK